MWSSTSPCDSWEFCPLQSTTHNSCWMSRVVRLGFGCLAVLTVTVSAKAQTYYYYPPSLPSTPTVTTGTIVAPTYYRRGLFGSRFVWTRSAPQYAQTQYAIQSYQTSYATQSTQATQTSDTQPNDAVKVSPVSFTAEDTAAATAAPAASTTVGDPYGFTAWLNATRATYGLPAVGHDPNLSSWAAVNNSHQAARGIGHFVMGPARRQNSAMGAFAQIGSMWMASPAHRAALLDPTIRWIGIAGLGAYWTFNAN